MNPVAPVTKYRIREPGYCQTQPVTAPHEPALAYPLHAGGEPVQLAFQLQPETSQLPESSCHEHGSGEKPQLPQVPSNGSHQQPAARQSLDQVCHEQGYALPEHEVLQAHPALEQSPLLSPPHDARTFWHDPVGMH